MNRARLVALGEIDQFAKVVRIPATGVSDDVLAEVRRLNERALESAVREILFDPNETPHGPTEIADIVTTRIVLRGRPVTAGFVLKGPSFPKVTSKIVSHQFAKLRTIPDLGLAVLMAVGDIQDDARRDFAQTASDATVPHLIVDTVDCARLLIAYEKICPRDGKLFRNDGTCACGQRRAPDAILEVPVKGDLPYEIVRLEDVSHAGAKRYSAVLVVDRHAGRDGVRDVISRALPEIREEEYHRSPQLEALWSGHRADVVYLYVAGGHDDVRHANWIARTQWVDPGLDPSCRPMPWDGDEVWDGVSILWNHQYGHWREFHRQHTGKKGPMLREIKTLVSASRPLVQNVIRVLSDLEAGKSTPNECDLRLRELAGQGQELGERGSDLPFSPEDLKAVDTAAQGLFSSLLNLSICYSELGERCRNQKERLRLARQAANDLRRDLERVDAEFQGVR
ncbi:hypothetical protein [Candidatus Palauibacter sp.]|uniref:hypothetical protein n=1 Tax=Candidatus Palauibacter sp. TaxID=3101350 RepID=UPI003B51BCC7